MKRKVIRIIVPALLVMIAASTVILGQKLGGYKEIAKDDEGAVAAAEFAVKDQSEKKEMTFKLVSVEKAETQVVAGINYRLCLKVSHQKEGDEAETTQSVRVVVFRSLQKEYSLTSWTEEDCGENNP